MIDRYTESYFTETFPLAYTHGTVVHQTVKYSEVFRLIGNCRYQLYTGEQAVHGILPQPCIYRFSLFPE
jgi:hypothetical protein